MKKTMLFLFTFIFATDSFASGIGNVSSASCDNETLAKYTGTADVEINWEPNTIGLKWYNGDQQISGQTSCVYDGTITVPPQPTKPGYTFNGWKVMSAVPEEYTQLEYVHFDGAATTGAYVNTGLNFYANIPNIKARFVADAKVYRGSDWQVIVGNLGMASAYMGPNRDNLFYYGFGGNDTSTSVYNPYVKCNFDLDLVAGTYKITNLNTNTRIVNISNISPVSRTYNMPIYLGGFTTNVGTTEMRPARTNMDLYNVEIYNNNVLVFKGVPVQRKSDSVVGIYDMVSKTFKTNASGTNALTAGPPVAE